jgi:hypothetical protein
MSFIIVPAPADRPRSRDHAAAIADTAADLSAFLESAELSADLEREAVFFLDGLRQVFEGIVERLAQAGPE